MKNIIWHKISSFLHRTIKKFRELALFFSHKQNERYERPIQITIEYSTILENMTKALNAVSSCVSSIVRLIKEALQISSRRFNASEKVFATMRTTEKEIRAEYTNCFIATQIIANITTKLTRAYAYDNNVDYVIGSKGVDAIVKIANDHIKELSYLAWRIDAIRDRFTTYMNSQEAHTYQTRIKTEIEKSILDTHLEMTASTIANYSKGVEEAIIFFKRLCAA